MSKFTPIPIKPVNQFTTVSEPFPMNNYRSITFVIESRKQDAEITFQIEAKKDDAEAEKIPFLFMENNGIAYEEIPSEGIKVTNDGTEIKTWLIMVNDRMLAHGEYDSVALVVTESAADAVSSIYALQTQPRYSDGQ